MRDSQRHRKSKRDTQRINRERDTQTGSHRDREILRETHTHIQRQTQRETERLILSFWRLQKSN